jgi:hypothetical protein
MDVPFRPRGAPFRALLLSSLALTIAACRPGTRYVTAAPAAVLTARGDSLNRVELNTYANSLHFDTTGLAGDEQKLSDTAGHNTGPLARIEPELGIFNLRSGDVSSGRILGRIIVEDTGIAYPKLSIVSGDTVYIFAQRDSLFFVPRDTSRSYRSHPMVMDTNAIAGHGGHGRWYRATARWKWTPHDEHVWMSCLQMGCCVSRP